MLTMTLLCVCTIVYVFGNGSPCHHLLLTKHRPALLSAFSPSREPQTIVSVVGHQSDTTETPVSCVDQDSVSAADGISVFQGFFSLVREGVCYGQFSSELLMTPKRSVVDDSGTPSQPSQASPDQRPSSRKNHQSEVATAVFSRICPEASSTSDPVELAEPDGPNEAVGDPGRRGHPNYPRRRRRGGIRNGHRTRRQSSGRGITSRHRVMSATSLESPGYWAFDALLDLRDVNIPAGTQCPAYRGYQNICPANSRTLPDFCCQTQPVNFGRHRDGYRSYNVQQHPGHVWVQHHRGNTLMAALISPMLETRRWQATKISLVSTGWKLLTPRSHTKSFFPQTCGYQSQQNWAWRVDGA